MKTYIQLLINQRAGSLLSRKNLQELKQVWSAPKYILDIAYISSKTESMDRARKVKQHGYDQLIIAGGDGTLNTIGSALIGSNIPIGVLPTGSGNGFARHYGIPLNIEEAAYTLRQGKLDWLDAGFANGNPFFVTCSCGWEASLLQIYEKSIFRGLSGYVYAGLHQTAFYRSQPLQLHLPGQIIHLNQPYICTFANLSQYGNNIVISPSSTGDDGKLQLVAIEQSDVFSVLKMMTEQQDALAHLMHPEVISRSFTSLRLHRNHITPLQLDGELFQTQETVELTVRPKALQIIVPT
jgi:diacylglycerol kinase family enzyme